MELVLMIGNSKMSYENKDLTLHLTHTYTPNCEYCGEIVQSWYSRHWISATEYARLMQLPF
ncbi:hypothetical protein BH10ACI1_BH10ACI1_02660 [soil metagenome]